MGYTIKVAQILCPNDIGEPIRLECVFLVNGIEQVRENIVYSAGMNNMDIEIALKNWVTPYIKRREEKEAIKSLTIIGKDIPLEKSIKDVIEKVS